MNIPYDLLQILQNWIELNVSDDKTTEEVRSVIWKMEEKKWRKKKKEKEEEGVIILFTYRSALLNWAENPTANGADSK